MDCNDTPNQQPDLEEIRQKHESWLAQLEAVAVQAIVTDRWDKVYKLIDDFRQEQIGAIAVQGLINLCWRSRELHFITCDRTGRILTQSEEFTGFIGTNSTDLLTENLYFCKQDRLDFLEEIRSRKSAFMRTRMQKMDGQLFDATLTSQLFEFGAHVAVLFEHLQPVRDYKPQ